MARAAGKSIVAVKLGRSQAGRDAALAHTGSLAGSVEAFDAVAGDVGVICADTLDDAVEITELLVHTGAPPIAACCSMRRNETASRFIRWPQPRPKGSKRC